MLRREDHFMIQVKRNQGMYVKDIAADLGVHPKTVSRALQRGGPPTGQRGRPKGHEPSSIRSSLRWIDSCRRASGMRW